MGERGFRTSSEYLCPIFYAISVLVLVMVLSANLREDYVYVLGLWARAVWVQISAQPLASCVIWGDSNNYSGPQFSRL